MNTMESSKFDIVGYIVIAIVLLLLLNFLFNICLVKFKQFSNKNLQEKQISIIFASEKERDAVLALIKKDKEETEELEKQAKDFGLK